MTATATHDTKRGEDARTRILALAEIADDWAAAVRELARAERAAAPRWPAPPPSPRTNTCSIRR